MKYLHLLSLACFLPFSLSAQLSVTATRTFTTANDWQVAAEHFVFHRHTDFLKHGVSASVEYRLPLRSKHWSLAPALRLMQASYGFRPARFETSTAGLELNASLFFSPMNEERPRGKGLALQASAGLDWLRKMYLPLREDGHRDRYTNAGLAFQTGIGAFWQLTLSERLSVAPFAQVRWYPDLKWKGLTEQLSGGAWSGDFDRTHWFHYNFGLKCCLVFFPSGS